MNVFFCLLFKKCIIKQLLNSGISIVLKTHAVFLQEKWQTVENKSNHLDPVFRGVEHIEHSCSIEYSEEVSSC